ncbi:hypothetical protein [Mycobacterium intracellulare]|uniref:hypothetical protein n=1 Tax=Mycobacterium intracellulare TaxID=1767 RepID=UPI000B5DA169|nr:hypothetical protein [Mycobacterium intracellulare]
MSWFTGPGRYLSSIVGKRGLSSVVGALEHLTAVLLSQGDPGALLAGHDPWSWTILWRVVQCLSTLRCGLGLSCNLLRLLLTGLGR